MKVLGNTASICNKESVSMQLQHKNGFMHLALLFEKTNACAEKLLSMQISFKNSSICRQELVPMHMQHTNGFMHLAVLLKETSTCDQKLLSVQVDQMQLECFARLPAFSDLVHLMHLNMMHG